MRSDETLDYGVLRTSFESDWNKAEDLTEKFSLPFQSGAPVSVSSWKEQCNYRPRMSVWAHSHARLSPSMIVNIVGNLI